MERGKILNPKYSIVRDQPASRASPLRINVLLFRVLWFFGWIKPVTEWYFNANKQCKWDQADDNQVVKNTESQSSIGSNGILDIFNGKISRQIRR